MSSLPSAAAEASWAGESSPHGGDSLRPPQRHKPNVMVKGTIKDRVFLGSLVLVTCWESLGELDTAPRGLVLWDSAAHTTSPTGHTRAVQGRGGTLEFSTREAQYGQKHTASCPVGTASAAGLPTAPCYCCASRDPVPHRGPEAEREGQTDKAQLRDLPPV